MIPFWLHLISLIALIVGGGSAIGLAALQFHYRQHMAIMYAVWPLVALFLGPAAIALYFADRPVHRGEKMEHHRQATITPLAITKAALHCGSGCTLGDIVAETLVMAFPAIAIFFGWHGLFASKIPAGWIFDFLLAFGFGIVFQYFSIVPMRHLSFGEGLIAALKADTLSLTTWQLGMYGAMTIVQFAIARPVLGHTLTPDTFEFWFAMQIAMIAGLATAWPMNAWLLKKGWKEAM